MTHTQVVVLLFALTAVGLCHGVRARALSYHRSGPGGRHPDGPAVSPPWDAFTKFENTWVLAPRLFSNDTADTADECAMRCYRNARCTHWTWCPPPPFPGALCEVMLFGDLTSYEGTGPTTCLLSYDPRGERKATLFMDGGSVSWMGGFHVSRPRSSSPTDPSPPTQPAMSPEPAPEFESAPAPEPSSLSLDSPTFDFCSVFPNTLYAPTGKDAEVVGTFDDVVSEVDCCERCFHDDECNAWFLCYGDADSCTEWEFGGKTYSTDEEDIQPGTCILWKIPNVDEITLVSENPATPWASGSLSDDALVMWELRYHSA